MSNAHDENKNPPPAKEDWFGRIFEGKVGVAVVGAILTTITTVALPWWLSQLAQDRQAEQHKLDAETQALVDARKDRQAETQTLTQKIENPVLERLAATELLIQLHGRNAGDSEVADVWNKYWAAYQNYFVFAEGSAVPQDRLTVSGPQAEYLDEHPVLWTYLNSVVGPEFEKIHGCLVTAHQSYDAKSAAPNTGSDSRFRSCLAQGAGANAFWTRRTDDRVAPDPWARFKKCVGSFLIQLHYGLEWREQLEEEMTKEATPRADRKISQCPPGYTGDQWCRQMRYNRDVYQQMRDDCGPLSPDELKSLDLED
jgi:hypothetical protein